MSRRFDPSSLPASVRARNPHLVGANREPTDARGQRAGASAKAGGDSWEHEVAGALAALTASGAVAHHLRHDAKKIERAERVVGRVPAACDFAGVLASARAFCVECKSAKSGAVYASRAHALAARRSRAPAFTDEQRAQLDAYERVGAPALVAVRLGDARFLARWRDVSGAASLDAAALAAWPWRGGRALAEALAVGREESPRRRVGRRGRSIPAHFHGENPR